MIQFAEILALLALSYVLFSCSDPRHSNGEFLGELILKSRPDGRTMQLVQSFGYKDQEGRKWVVPSAWIIDGASIPRVLWSIAGGPYSGKYREASVIHDYFCYVKRRPWEQVHRLFYEIMLASGVEARKAKIMYLAVYRFGPRWDFPLGGACLPPAICSGGAVKEFQPQFNKMEFNQIKAQVELLQPGESMESIERELDEAFLRDVRRGQMKLENLP